MHRKSGELEIHDVEEIRINVTPQYLTPPHPIQSYDNEVTANTDANKKGKRKLTVTPNPKRASRGAARGITQAYNEAVSTFRLRDKGKPDEKQLFEYISTPFTGEVVPDPIEIKHAWLQSGADFLYHLLVVDSVLGAFIIALTLFITVTLPEIYTKDVLRREFFKKRFINLYAYMASHFAVMIIAIIFLCYPSRLSWGRFQKLRWFLIGIPNTILVLAVMEQFSNVIEHGEYHHQLKDIMQLGIDISVKTRLSHKVQPYFKCCGVSGYEDWEPIIEDNSSIYLGGYPRTCCSSRYVYGCSYPVQAVVHRDDYDGPYFQLWHHGCLEYEAALLHALWVTVWIFMIISAIVTIFATYYLWWIVRHVNIHDAVLSHPFSR